MNSTTIDETFKNFIKNEDNMTIDGLDENGKKELWNAGVEYETACREYENKIIQEYGGKEQFWNNIDEVTRRLRVFQEKWIEDRKKATGVDIRKGITLTHEEWIQEEYEMCVKYDKKQQLQNEDIKKHMIENYTNILTIGVSRYITVCEYKPLAIELFSKKMKSFTPTKVFEKDEQHFIRICNEVNNELEKMVRQADEKKCGDIYDLLCEEDSNKQIKKDTKKKQPVSKKKNICSCGIKNCEPRPPKERFSPAGIKINTKPLQEAWDRKHGRIPPLLQKI